MKQSIDMYLRLFSFSIRTVILLVWESMLGHVYPEMNGSDKWKFFPFHLLIKKKKIVHK